MSTVDYKAPLARRVLPANASREEWLLQRRKGLGGTDTATLAGVNKFSSPYEVWLEKHDTEPPVEVDKDIFWYGHVMEPIIIQRFKEKTGIEVRQVGTYVSKEHPELYVNPDGFTSDGGVLEMKTTDWYTESGEIWNSGEIPDHPMMQIQKALAVTGRSHGWIVALVDRSLKIHGPIPRDEEMISDLIARETAWWQKHIVDGVEPAIDYATVDYDELLLRFPSASEGKTLVADDAPIPELIVDSFIEFARVRDARLQAEKAEKELKARLVAHLGESETLIIGGKPAATWKNKAGASYVDVDALLSLVAELQDRPVFEVKTAFTKRRAPSRSLLVSGGKNAFDYTTYGAPQLFEEAA